MSKPLISKPLRKSKNPSTSILPMRTRCAGPLGKSFRSGFPDLLVAARKNKRRKTAWPFLSLPTKNLDASIQLINHHIEIVKESSFF